VVKPARKKALVEAILRVLPAPGVDLPTPDDAPPLAAAEPPDAEEPVLDRSAFATLVSEIGEESAAEIRTVFVSETDIRLKLLRQLSIERERTKIGREAHSLKSAAGTFGYRRLASLALRLEKSAIRLSDAEYRQLLDLIEGTYASARAQEAAEN
jgi:HPt (histidine-containing phosphotransfer) domain-containing protein